MQRCTARRPHLYLPASSEVSLLTNCYQACFLDSENLPARPNDMARALIRILFACSAALHEDLICTFRPVKKLFAYYLVAGILTQLQPGTRKAKRCACACECTLIPTAAAVLHCTKTSFVPAHLS